MKILQRIKHIKQIKQIKQIKHMKFIQSTISNKLDTNKTKDEKRIFFKKSNCLPLQAGADENTLTQTSRIWRPTACDARLPENQDFVFNQKK